MYTLCINNGLVIDPETETARIASVGVRTAASRRFPTLRSRRKCS